MALLVSIGFSSLLSPCQSPVLKRLDGQLMRTGAVVSSSPSSRRALNTLSLQLTRGTITTKNLDCHCSIRASFEDTCSYHSVVGCCTLVIAGYWIGPDPEDGWGFVEAFLNKVR